ncbi:MAG: nucleotide pyrophosphohydrolase, partial [Chloroflexota bacterium]
LRTKLIEEAHEAAETNSESDLIKELADLFEVAEAVMKANGIDVETVKDKQQERCESRGGFEQRIFLLWTE